MAVYDMITDENGNQVQAAPYYMSGSERITVSGEYTKAPAQPQTPSEPFDWTILKWTLWIVGGLGLIGFFISLITKSNGY